VWTGCNNFTGGSGKSLDEMMVKINGAAAYRAYRDWFHFITVRKSSPVWAYFIEGGPKALRPKAARPAAPVVLAPANDIRIDPHGHPYALD
jgi:hypothetical protein